MDNFGFDLGRKWTQHELTAYNVTFSSLPPAELFPDPDPSLDNIDPAVLDSHNHNNHTLSDTDVGQFLAYLTFATKPTQESFLVDFAAEALRFLDFEEDRHLVVRYHDLPLTTSGGSCAVVRLDACLLDLHRPSPVILMRSLVSSQQLLRPFISTTKSTLILASIPWTPRPSPASK